MSQQINLYSPIFRKQQKVFSATTMLQGVAADRRGRRRVLLLHCRAELAAADPRRRHRRGSCKSELERLKAYGAGDSPAERAKALAERARSPRSRAGERTTQALAAFESDALGRTEGYSRGCCARSRGCRWKASGSRASSSAPARGSFPSPGARRARIWCRPTLRACAPRKRCARADVRPAGNPAQRRGRQVGPRAEPFVEFTLSSGKGRRPNDQALLGPDRRAHRRHDAAPARDAVRHDQPGAGGACARRLPRATPGPAEKPDRPGRTATRASSPRCARRLRACSRSRKPVRRTPSRKPSPAGGAHRGRRKRAWPSASRASSLPARLPALLKDLLGPGRGREAGVAAGAARRPGRSVRTTSTATAWS